MRLLHRPATLLIVAAALGLAACGSSDDKDLTKQAKAAQVSPAKAADEAQQTESALDKALNTYREGDRKGASGQIADAYLDHFEKVEGPLSDIDQPLMQRLETSISVTLRQLADKGVEVSQLARRMAAIETQLDLAVTKLKAAP